MTSQSIEQRHDSIWKPESASILSCSSWRSSQSPHVPFELERFQFLPLTTGSKVCSKERFFQDVEAKWLQVILSLLLSLLVFVLHNLSVLFFFWVSLVLLFCLTCFCCFFFGVFYFVFHIKIEKKLKNQKKKKYKNSVFVYIGICVSWMVIETKFLKLCISCSLDDHLYAQLSKRTSWLLFVMSKIKLSLVLNTHITLFDWED